MLTVMLIPTIFAGSMGVLAITQAQNPIPNFLLSPLGAVIFLIAAIAELGRSPFDMGEAESELVSGYNIEYSGMKFGMFYAGELLHAFTFGGFWAIMFFGGFGLFGLENLPGLTWLNNPFINVATLLVKALVGYWVIMWVKYTLLRIRIDHMLAFNWKFLTPVAFTLLIATAFMNALLRGTPTWLYVLGLFLTNVLVGWISLEAARAYSRREREKVEGVKKTVEVGHS
jgi:NADH-quinone oxidoreductase subunit H